MRKHSLLGLIFIFLVGLLYNSSAQSFKNINSDPIQEEELLMQAIEVGGFQINQLNINTSVIIPDTFFTMEELEEKQNELLDTLKIEGDIVYINMEELYNSYHGDYFEDPLDIESETILIQKVEETGYNEIILLIPDEAGNVTLIKLLSSQIVGEAETYIIVDITKNKGYKEIVEVNNQIENVLEKYGSEIETTINLTGTHSGKFTKSEEKQFQDQIFSFLGANKVEVLEDELFTSITAYSPAISSYINYGGKKVNLQLAMRYSEYEDQTYLWLANPLITTTY